MPNTNEIGNEGEKIVIIANKCFKIIDLIIPKL